MTAAGVLNVTSRNHLPLRRGGQRFGGGARVGVFISVLTAGICLVAAGVAGAQPMVAGGSPGDGSGGSATSPTTLMVTSSGSTTVGLQVFVNVNLMGVTSPTGTMTFALFGPADSSCAAAPVFISTVAVTGTSINSARYTATTAGTYRWRATYSGDANNAASGPTACANASASVIVGQAYSALSLTAMAPVGNTLRASAAVNGYDPAGSVTFYLSPPGDMFCSTTVFTSTVAVTSAAATSAPYVATAGQYKWRASYSGDANNQYDPVTACLDPNAAVTVAAPNYASFSYPVDGQAGVDTWQPFAWPSVSAAQGYRVTIGTINQGADLVNSPVLAASQTSYQAPPLPPGRTLFATVYTEVNGTWSNSQSVSFTAAGAWASFTYPVDGQANVDTAVAFSWQPRPQSQGYLLTVGSTYGGYDLLWSGILPAGQTSYSIPALPAGTIHALLYTAIGGTWYGQAIAFTANATEAGFTSPGNNQTNVGTNTTFTWSTAATGQSYTLWIGTSYLGEDVMDSEALPASQSFYTPPTLPSGRLLYATLFTFHTNGTTTSQTIAFSTGGTASGAGGLSAASSLSPGLSALAVLPAAPQ
jgi:hypothetical protein